MKTEKTEKPKEVIHFIALQAPGYQRAACGKVSPAIAVITWQRVTCKECLKTVRGG